MNNNLKSLTVTTTTRYQKFLYWYRTVRYGELNAFMMAAIDAGKLIPAEAKVEYYHYAAEHIYTDKIKSYVLFKVDGDDELSVRINYAGDLTITKSEQKVLHVNLVPKMKHVFKHAVRKYNSNIKNKKHLQVKQALSKLDELFPKES